MEKNKSKKTETKSKIHLSVAYVPGKNNKKKGILSGNQDEESESLRETL